jgi:hypothetical protein
MQSRLLFAAVVLFGGTGCVRVSTTRIARAEPSIPADSVQVFATRSPNEYTELAVLRPPSAGRTPTARRAARRQWIVVVEHARHGWRSRFGEWGGDRRSARRRGRRGERADGCG